jgi:cyclase
MEQYIRVIETRNVDELIILDIEATPKGRPPNYVKLRQFCDNLYCPVTYGGGIRTLDDIRDALSNGADKVAIKTHLDIIPKAAEKFGSQAIVAVLDNSVETAIGCDAAWCEDQGAGEILLTCRASDGTMDGYNLNLIEHAVMAVDIPVIANGGCGEPVHMLQALEAGASAVAAGSMFLYTEETPRTCAEKLTEWGCNVRLV